MCFRLLKTENALMLHFTVNRNTVVFSGIVQKEAELHQKAKRLNF